MEPIRQHQEAFAVAGLRVRTTNAQECDPATQRIAGLWQRFFAAELFARTPHRTADNRSFGVYANYESDANGAFDVIAGVAVSEGGTVQIAAGDYLVFKAHGELPQAVLDAWQRIWQYFEAHPEIRRSYRSDFEAYTGPTDLTVHIGVE